MHRSATQPTHSDTERGVRTLTSKAALYRRLERIATEVLTDWNLRDAAEQGIAACEGAIHRLVQDALYAAAIAEGQPVLAEHVLLGLPAPDVHGSGSVELLRLVAEWSRVRHLRVTATGGS